VTKAEIAAELNAIQEQIDAILDRLNIDMKPSKSKPKAKAKKKPGSKKA
jgi:hypothetical protein